MKSLYYLPILFLSLATTYAQSDTLYVNDTYVLALIFPEPISRAVTGHSNYTFSYNTDTPGRLGLLQGHSGTDSNLLVLTRDGLAYSYYLTYRKQPIKSHRFVNNNDAIGNVLIKKRLDSLDQEEKSISQNITQTDSVQYRKVSNHFLERNAAVLKAKRKDGIVLRLRNVAYFGKETYIVLELENKSNIDFEVDFIQLFKVHGNPRKKSSYQKLSLEPLYSYKSPYLVKVGHMERFVYVVPKFILADQEKLLMELWEKHGSRTLTLVTK